MDTFVAASSSAGQRLRVAWAVEPVQIPGVFCSLVAKMAERLGFQACYLSGGGFSASLGLPDLGLVTLSEFVQEANRICQATTLPVISDADTGFGEALNVERTVQLFEQAGLAGLHLEDQLFPKRCGHLAGKSLVPVEVMESKIRAAVRARRDPNFVIIARTDARGVTDFADAVERAKRYLDCGADVIFPEAMQSEMEFAEFARCVSAPLLANMTEFGQSPILDQSSLGQLGYRLILYPLTVFRPALKMAELALLELKTIGHQRNIVPKMMTRAELYSYLGYSEYEERDRAYANPASS